jgi:DNA polymerase
MPTKKTQDQLGELAGQVRTHLEYLTELGVDAAEEFRGLGVKLGAKKPALRAPAPDRPSSPVQRANPAPMPLRPSGPVAATPSAAPAARLADLPRLGAPRNPATRSPIIAAGATKPKTPQPALASIFETEPSLVESPAGGETLASIHEFIGNCTRCPLHEGRTKIVNTEGNPNARLMFVGEAPGADEDAQGRPFVGRAGQLLNKIIEAIGLRRDEVLIGNINRCRPPQNRAPLPNEVAACKPFILREIGAVRPEVVVVLGNTAMKNLLGTKEGITKVRGIFQDYQGIKVMPTFHPAYLLRDPSKKRETWDDLKKVRDYLAQKDPSTS